MLEGKDMWREGYVEGRDGEGREGLFEGKRWWRVGMLEGRDG